MTSMYGGGGSSGSGKTFGSGGRGNIKPSCFLAIRNFPSDWTIGFINSKFSHYGPIEEVTFEVQDGRKIAVIEFENEEDAVGTVEDFNSCKEAEYSLSFYDTSACESESVQSFLTFVDSNERKTKNYDDGISVNFMHCSNTNCTGQVVIEGECDISNNKKKIYCSQDCYLDDLDTMGRVNIWDKWIASLGKSGTGLLKDSDNLDRIVIHVDSDGNRSSTWSKNHRSTS